MTISSLVGPSPNRKGAGNNLYIILLHPDDRDVAGPGLSVPQVHQLKRSSLLGTLPTLGMEWILSFDFRPTDYSFKGWTSLVHMTIGSNSGNYGDRTPAIFFHPTQGMHVTSAINGNKNWVKNVAPPPPIGEWTTLSVSQKSSGGKYFYSIQVGGQEIFSVENTQPREFSNVKVYASDPWYTAQPGDIRALTIIAAGTL